MSANTPVANKWTKRFPIAVIVLGVAALLSYLVTSPLPAIHWGASISKSGSSIQRGWEADTARYTAMAEFYAAQAEGIQRGLKADAARYTAMTKHFAAPQESVQLSRQADTARYTAMAEFYAAKEAANLQRGRDADAARYIAMAKYYMAK